MHPELERRAFLSFLTAMAVEPCAAISRPPAPPFEARTLIGRRLRLDDYKGKTLILVFWATWCPHCRRYLDAMQEMHAEFEARKLSMLALSVDAGGWKDVAPYVRDHKITIPVALATPQAQAAYDASRGVPLTVIIDGNGGKLKEFLGAPNAQQLRQMAEALAEKA